MTRWPFRHNWTSSYVVTYSFKTEVLTSRSGMEQRRAIRYEPRRTVETTVLSAGDFQGQVDAWLWGRQSDLFEHVSPVDGVSEVVRLPTEVSLAWRTAAVNEATITFAVEPGTDAYEAPEPDAMLSFRNRYIFPRDTDWQQGVTDTLSFPRQTVDFDAGRIAVDRPVSFGSRTSGYARLTVGSEETQEVVGFFGWARGRQHDFWTASTSDDLTLVSLEGSTLIAAGDVTPMVDGRVNVAVRINLNTGAVYFRSVLSAALLGGLTYLQLDDDVPDVALPGTVAQVSWVRVGRFASDDLSVEWVTSTVAKIQPQVLTLPYRDPEVGPGFDGDTSAVIDYYGLGFFGAGFGDPLDFIVNVQVPRLSGDFYLEEWWWDGLDRTVNRSS